MPPYSQHRPSLPSLAVDREARSGTGRLQSSATISNGTRSQCVGPGFDSLRRLDPSHLASGPLLARPGGGVLTTA
jgi:hypothetical protein